MNFGKSLMMAGAVTAAVLTSVVVAGTVYDFEGGDADKAALNTGPQTVHTRPVAVDVSGYDLKRRTKNDVLFIVARIRVDGGAAKAEVCRLMPRLTAVVLQDLGPKLQGTEGQLEKAGTDLGSFLQRRFNRALGRSPVVDAVEILPFKDQFQAPETHCEEDVG